MRNLIFWIIVMVVIGYSYQAGWLNSIIEYVNTAYNEAKKERVIQESDGSITTVRYKNVFQIFSGK